MKIRYAVILGTLLLLCAGWILSTTSSFNTCKANQTAAKSEQAKEHSPPFILALTNNAAICVRCTGHVIYEYRDAVTAIATVFIAIFTLTLWASTSGMLKATRLAIGLARQEFLSTHRPKIILREAFTTELKEGENVKIFLHLANIGETAGIIIGSQVSAIVVPMDRVMIHPTLDLNFDDAFGRIKLRQGGDVRT